MTSRRMFSAALTLILALSAMAPALNGTPTKEGAPAPTEVATANPAATAEPLAVQGCDACKPKILSPKVRYLRFNGSLHEVEVSFAYQLPSCITSLDGVEFKAVSIQLQFPNGVKRERIGAGINMQRCSGGTGGGTGACVGTLVRVDGSASDRNPLSYFVSVSGRAPIHGFGVSNNSTPF